LSLPFRSVQWLLPIICSSKNIWYLRRAVSVEVSMNSTLPQNTVIPAIPNASRLAGNAKNLKADSDHDHMNELAAMRHHQRWQHDRTKMLAFL
jgi:hypothetical protein